MEQRLGVMSVDHSEGGGAVCPLRAEDRSVHPQKLTKSVLGHWGTGEPPSRKASESE